MVSECPELPGCCKQTRHMPQAWTDPQVAQAIYIYMYICMYICIYSYIYMHIYIYMHVDSRTYRSGPRGAHKGPAHKSPGEPIRARPEREDVAQGSCFEHAYPSLACIHRERCRYICIYIYIYIYRGRRIYLYICVYMEIWKYVP